MGGSNPHPKHFPRFAREFARGLAGKEREASGGGEATRAGGGASGREQAGEEVGQRGVGGEGPSPSWGAHPPRPLSQDPKSYLPRRGRITFPHCFLRTPAAGYNVWCCFLSLIFWSVPQYLCVFFSNLSCWSFIFISCFGWAYLFLLYFG